MTMTSTMDKAWLCKALWSKKALKWAKRICIDVWTFCVNIFLCQIDVIIYLCKILLSRTVIYNKGHLCDASGFKVQDQKLTSWCWHLLILIITTVLSHCCSWPAVTSVHGQVFSLKLRLTQEMISSPNRTLTFTIKWGFSSNVTSISSELPH